MTGKRRIITLIFLLSLFLVKAIGINKPSFRNKERYTRIGIAPAIGFYTINTNHAKSPTSRLSFSFFFKREWSVDRSNKVFFSLGAEYFLHGINFKSYYFLKDSLKLYDRSFGYNYGLFINEINLPVQTKFTFNSTTNSMFTPYVSLGYYLRYLSLCNAEVSQNGNLVRKEDVDLKFNNPLFYNKLNSFAGISLGFQSNKSRNKRITFFIETTFKYGFSPYYFQTDYSASSLYINSSHLLLHIGFGF